MYRSVVIALDGSEQAARAVPQGVDLARQFGAIVVLVRAIRPVGETDKDDREPGAMPNLRALTRRDYDLQRSQAEGYIDAVKRSVQSSDVLVEARIEDGEPAEVISRVAASLPEPVIVITPHGKSSTKIEPGDGAFGSVAYQVLSGSSAPVLVAKSR